MIRKGARALSYSNNKQAKKEIRETTPVTIATDNMYYFGVALTKQVKDLYDKNFKTLKKENEEGIRKWKDPLCSGKDRINIIKMAIYNSTQSPSESQHNFSQPSKEQYSTSYGKKKHPG